MARKSRVDFLAVGFSDAIGFVIGCLMDVFARGYDNSSMGGIVLVGLGGGLGLQLARRWQQGRQRQDKDS
ncbi:MAG: hypothetical protein EBT37_11810 [Betaproteobacteria bacterium]|nr:hypothetical protein [Betaproteobacteria bacterium]